MLLFVRNLAIFGCKIIPHCESYRYIFAFRSLHGCKETYKVSCCEPSILLKVPQSQLKDNMGGFFAAQSFTEKVYFVHKLHLFNVFQICLELRRLHINQMRLEEKDTFILKVVKSQLTSFLLTLCDCNLLIKLYVSRPPHLSLLFLYWLILGK